MNTYLLLLELFFFAFTGYILIVKKQLAIIYLPVLFVSRNLYDSFTRALVWYLILLIIMTYLIYKNRGYTRNNIYSIILVVYFTILFSLSTDAEGARSGYISAVVFFLSIPICQQVYKKYDRSIIDGELCKMALIVLLIFISNTIMSTLYGFSGERPMYGFAGVVYGNMRHTDFNIIPIVLFILLYKILKEYSTFDLLVAIVSFSFLLLTMRRSVIVAAITGVGIIMLMLIIEKNKSKSMMGLILAGMIAVFLVSGTNILDRFWERYEQRDLHEEKFVSREEERFTEYGILYSDMFVNKRYSPLFGYELFNSPGNYGDGINQDRSLHSDIPVIVHASGLVGLLLYLLMVTRTFLISYVSSETTNEKMIILFCVLVFIIFAITGRFTKAETMIAMFMLILLPNAKYKSDDQYNDKSFPEVISGDDYETEKPMIMN